MLVEGPELSQMYWQSLGRALESSLSAQLKSSGEGKPGTEMEQGKRRSGKGMRSERDMGISETGQFIIQNKTKGLSWHTSYAITLFKKYKQFCLLFYFFRIYPRANLRLENESVVPLASDASHVF